VPKKASNIGFISKHQVAAAAKGKKGGKQPTEAEQEFRFQQELNRAIMLSQKKGQKPPTIHSSSSQARPKQAAAAAQPGVQPQQVRKVAGNADADY